MWEPEKKVVVIYFISSPASFQRISLHAHLSQVSLSVVFRPVLLLHQWRVLNQAGCLELDASRSINLSTQAQTFNWRNKRRKKTLLLPGGGF